MNRRTLAALFAVLLVGVLVLSACGGASQEQGQTSASEPPTVIVYKSPTCGCCTKWAEHLEENGFQVKMEDVQNLSALKNRYRVPTNLRSCHTAVVDGYVVEGHVPAQEVQRLLEERPDVAGITVPGMPVGSPGMEVPGAAPQPFEVIAFDKNGNTEVFARYPQ